MRFPFKWERLQYELNGELNRHDLDKMKDFVAAAAERDMVVMLDLHNYCRRYMNGEHTIIGTNGLTPEHLASFWKSLATEFKSFDNIYAYGLMNEPHDLDSCTTWFEMAQLCIDSIRTVDMDTRIMVGGNHWSSAERWVELSDTLKYLKDPADKLAFEAHVYFDADASGTYKRGYDEDSCYLEKGIDRVRPFVEWLKANKFEGMVGEYGIPDSDSRWNLVLDKFLSYLQENDINGCYWAAGPWWPKDEFMAITPVDGKDRPQMDAKIRSICPGMYSYCFLHGLSRLLSKYERIVGRVNRSIFLTETCVCLPTGVFCNIPMELRFSIWEIRLGS